MQQVVPCRDSVALIAPCAPEGRKGRASIQSHQMPVWPHQGSLPRPEKEHPAVAYLVCLGELVDGPCPLAGEQPIQTGDDSLKRQDARETRAS